MTAKKKTPAKKAAPAPKQAATISVGAPARPATVNVLGIDFEQGDNMKFGKCQYRNNRTGLLTGSIYHFIDIGGPELLLWTFGNNYLDHCAVPRVSFEKNYLILDWDTPTTSPTGIGDDDFDDDYIEDEDF